MAESTLLKGSDKRLAASYGNRPLNAHTAADADAKAKFHREARAYLRRVGDRIAELGYPSVDVKSNVAGHGIGGEVTLYVAGGFARGVRVQIGSPGYQLTGGRPDGVSGYFRAIARGARGGSHPSSWASGVNRPVDLTLSADELAAHIQSLMLGQGRGFWEGLDR